MGRIVSGAAKLLCVSTAAPVSSLPEATPAHQRRYAYGAVPIDIDHCEIQFAVLSARSGRIDHRHVQFAMNILGRCHRCWEGHRIHERPIQVEQMIGGRQHHLVAIGQNDRLQHIHHLRDIGHLHPVVVPVEDVLNVSAATIASRREFCR